MLSDPSDDPSDTELKGTGVRWCSCDVICGWSLRLCGYWAESVTLGVAGRWKEILMLTYELACPFFVAKGLSMVIIRTIIPIALIVFGSILVAISAPPN